MTISWETNLEDIFYNDKRTLIKMDWGDPYTNVGYGQERPFFQMAVFYSQNLIAQLIMDLQRTSIYRFHGFDVCLVNFFHHFDVYS